MDQKGKQASPPNGQAANAKLKQSGKRQEGGGCWFPLGGVRVDVPDNKLGIWEGRPPHPPE